MRSTDHAPALADVESLVSVLPCASLLLAPDAPTFTIVAASDAYLAVTATARRSLIGRGLFEVFPERPGEGGLDVLRSSLDHVLATREAHEIPLQRYDVRSPDGHPEERHWRERNVPVFDREGVVRYVLHTVDDLTESVRSAAALELANRRLADVLGQLDVLDQIGDGVVVCDRDRRVVYANDRMERMSGKRADELLGRDFGEAWPGAADPELERRLRGAVASGAAVHFTDRRVSESGDPASDQWFDVDAYPLTDGLAVFYRDVTERQRTREERDVALVRERIARDRAERLQRLAAALSRSLSRQDVADVIVVQMIDAFEGSAGGIVELSDDATEFVLLSTVGFSPQVREEFARFPIDAPVPVREVANTRRPVFLRSAEEWTALCGQPPRVTVTSSGEVSGAWAALPLLVEDELLGALTLSFSHSRDFSADDREFMTAFAHQCAQALARARLFEAERVARAEAEHARKRVEFLGRASAELAASLDVRATLDAVARFAVPDLADWCFVEMFDEGDRGARVLRPVAVGAADPARVSLAWEVYRRYPLRPENEIGSIQVARTGEPVLATEIPAGFFAQVAHDAEHLRLLCEVGFRSIVQVPLRAQGRVVGVLTFATTDESGRRYGTADLALAQEVAARVGVALETAALYAAEREARERLRLATEAAKIGAFEWHVPTGRVTWTEEEERLFGLEPGTFEGRIEAWGRRLVPEDLAGMERAMGEAMARRQPEMAFTFRILRPNASGAQETRWIEGTARFLYLPDGTPDRMVGINIDVTERRRAEEDRSALLAHAEEARREAELARAEAEMARHNAEEANRAKSEFLAIMSHELRTPLNAIDGYAELMELGIHGPLTEPQREALARVRRSQKHLLGLINQVLNYARLETGAVRYDLTDVPVSEVLHLVEGLLAPQMRAKELQYHVALTDAGACVRADREKVQQILVNLLSNAVKFTPPGGRVGVDCVGGPAVVALTVRDTGIGIPPDKLDTIFEPFVQVDARLARTQEGVGLGLAISRDLARGMGGNLVVESQVGVGSAFHVTLPRA